MKHNVFLVLGSSVVTLFLAEFFLILMGIEQPFSGSTEKTSFYDHFTNIPPTHYYSFGADIRFDDTSREFFYTKYTNNLGFVDDDVPDSFPVGTCITFGDSFTEGAGAPQRKSWPHQLEEMLDTVCQRFIFNFGIAGCDPVFSLKYFEDILLPRKPSMVLLCINETDIGEIAIRGDKSRFLENGKVSYRTPHELYWLFRRSRLARLIFKRLLGYDDCMWSSQRAAEEELWAANILAETVTEFNELCKKNEIEFAVIFHPFPSSYIPGNVYSSKLGSVVEGLQDMPVLDLFTPLNKRLPSNIVDAYYWEEDGHFNEAGYGAMAEEIFDFFINQLCPKENQEEGQLSGFPKNQDSFSPPRQIIMKQTDDNLFRGSDCPVSNGKLCSQNPSSQF